MLGIILFSILAKYNLICRIWAFQIIRSPAFEPNVLGLRFGLMQRGLDITLGVPFLWAGRAGL